MATNGLRDKDWLEGASNYVICKARISFLLDEHELKHFINNAQAESVDANTIKGLQEEYG